MAGPPGLSVAPGDLAPVFAVDARGHRIDLARPAGRIVSLVPSTTETLFDLGVGLSVVGVTRFCVHPAERTAPLPKVGGTKDVETEKVLALSPDLVVANCEENTRAIFEALDPAVPLWAAFPRDVPSAVADLRTLGRLVGAPDEAERWAQRIEEERSRLPSRRFTYTYLIWREPWMAVGTDTFISALLAEGGGINEVSGPDRFPALSLPDLASRSGRVLLSSEPFPFRERHAQELVRAGVHPDRIVFVDGERLSWHGTRLAQGLPYLASLAL